MRRLAIAAIAFLSTVPVLSKELPPPPRSHLLNEGVLRGMDAEYMGMDLLEIRARTGHDFYIALFQSLEGEDPADYAHRLFKAWEIGSKRADDGLLLCLFVRERRFRVEAGYGLEGALTDLESNAIVEAQAPRMRKGDYEAALNRIVETFTRKLETVPSRETAWEKFLWRWNHFYSEYTFLFLAMLILVPVLLFVLVSSWRDRRGIWNRLNTEPPEGWTGRSTESSLPTPPPSSSGGSGGGDSGTDSGGGGGSSGGAGASGSW
jgi:uncharacterized protein